MSNYIYISNKSDNSIKNDDINIQDEEFLSEEEYCSILSFNSHVNQSYKSKSDPYKDLKIISAVKMDFDIESRSSMRSQPLPDKPYKVLDAPEFEDDFYKQLLHWNQNNNRIAIGLSNSVYIWDSDTQEATFLYEFPEEENLCSLRWDMFGDKLAFGMGSGEIKIWDVCNNKNIQSLINHTSRVGCIDWGNDGLFSGSRDNTIKMTDTRQQNCWVKEFFGHTKQVLNVKCGSFGQPMILSSGNDSKLFLYDYRKEYNPVFKGMHEAPVRAIGWSPNYRGVFASGGGTSDQMLKIWDFNNKKLKNQVFVGSQICDLTFSSLDNEILLGLGGEKNSIDVYNLNQLQKVGSLNGHLMRVLNLDFSPDSTQMISASPDETMRFWEFSRLTRPRSNSENLELPEFSCMMEI